MSKPRLIAFAGAAALSGALVVVAVQAARDVNAAAPRPGVVAKAYNPDGERYRFRRPPAGSESAAAGCVVCHSLERRGAPRYAPNLWGIVGAPKARAGWFAYSQPLRTAGGAWTEKDLDRYLADPDAFLPGTRKTIRGIADDRRRAEVIDVLKTLRD